MRLFSWKKNGCLVALRPLELDLQPMFFMVFLDSNGCWSFILLPQSSAVSSVCALFVNWLSPHKISIFKEYNLVSVSPVKVPDLKPLYTFWFPEWYICKYPPPMPSDFQFKEPRTCPQTLKIPKSRSWYGLDIFWNRPMVGFPTLGFTCLKIAKQ